MLQSTTRANNVSQSERLLTFCVIDQSECMNFTMCKQKEWENSTLFYGLRAIRYCTFHFKTNNRHHWSIPSSSVRKWQILCNKVSMFMVSLWSSPRWSSSSSSSLLKSSSLSLSSPAEGTDAFDTEVFYAWPSSLTFGNIAVLQIGQSLISGRTHAMWNECPHPWKTVYMELCLLHSSKSHFLKILR